MYHIISQHYWIQDPDPESPEYLIIVGNHGISGVNHSEGSRYCNIMYDGAGIPYIMCYITHRSLLFYSIKTCFRIRTFPHCTHFTNLNSLQLTPHINISHKWTIIIMDYDHLYSISLASTNTLSDLFQMTFWPNEKLLPLCDNCIVLRHCFVPLISLYIREQF